MTVQNFNYVRDYCIYILLGSVRLGNSENTFLKTPTEIDGNSTQEQDKLSARKLSARKERKFLFNVMSKL